MTNRFLPSPWQCRTDLSYLEIVFLTEDVVSLELCFIYGVQGYREWLCCITLTPISFYTLCGLRFHTYARSKSGNDNSCYSAVREKPKRGRLGELSSKRCCSFWLFSYSLLHRSCMRLSSSLQEHNKRLCFWLHPLLSKHSSFFLSLSKIMDVGLLFMEMSTLMRFIVILYAPLHRRSFDLAKILSITRDISMITRLRLVVVFVGEGFLLTIFLFLMHISFCFWLCSDIRITLCLICQPQIH